MYVTDTMAGWELGNVMQAFSMEPMLCGGMPRFRVLTVGQTDKPVKTLGGLTIIPDCRVAEMSDDHAAALLIPGAETWKDDVHAGILEKMREWDRKGLLIAGICGATVALADLGMLDNRLHTSNSPEYLCMCSPNYRGKALYRAEPAVTGGNIITAGSAGTLLWAKKIIEYLDVYPEPVIAAWYRYYTTGNPAYYLELIQAAK